MFNPLSVFYCFARDPDGGAELVAVIAEVHNTYGGRHVYLLRPDESGRDTRRQGVLRLAVPADGRHYLMRTPVPGETSPCRSRCGRAGRRRSSPRSPAAGGPITTAASLAPSLRWPLLTLRTAALIRWQGIRLWLRRVPVQPRPEGSHLDERGR